MTRAPISPNAIVPGETVYFYHESNYYTIRLRRYTRGDGAGVVEGLFLDHLAHSFSDRDDPSYLHYDYLRVFERAVALWSARKDSLRLLFIGGGGYTLPRLVEQRYPHAQIDVIEVDPAVTAVAYEFMGLPRATRVRTINGDARWFMIAHAADSMRYDLIFVDAFSDLSIPYQLTTREFAGEMRRALAAGGAVFANVIDRWQAGAFLPSYTRTLESAFGAGTLALIGPSSAFEGRNQATFIVVASMVPIPTDALTVGGTEPGLGQLDLRAASELEFSRYQRAQPSVLLTDDHAPVDNLIGPLFAERFANGRR
ncbi:MAG: hypothetical protein PVSMB1_11660 [Gemmatimonadaceae bacterium]